MNKFCKFKGFSHIMSRYCANKKCILKKTGYGLGKDKSRKHSDDN